MKIGDRVIMWKWQPIQDLSDEDLIEARSHSHKLFEKLALSPLTSRESLERAAGIVLGMTDECVKRRISLPQGSLQ